MGDLFGGILKPGEAGLIALRRELERRRIDYVRRFPRPPYVYAGGADLCLRHGQGFIGQDCPEEYRHLVGPNGRCYLNALNAALSTPELRYFEGYYCWGKGLFTSHGWCVAPDGGAVELSIESWKLAEFYDKHGAPILPITHWTYWGVELSPALVNWHLHDPAGPLELPMMDRSEDDARDDFVRSRGFDMTQNHDFSILKVPYDPHRTQL